MWQLSLFQPISIYPKALEDYNFTLRLPNPEPWNVHLNRALVYEKMNNVDEAEMDLLDARKLAPHPIQGVENALARIHNPYKKPTLEERAVEAVETIIGRSA